MNRVTFIEKLIRFILFGLLAMFAIVLSGRTVNNSDCSSCPGNGICKGETDCTNFVNDK
jgi:hypothetical protein